MLGRAPPAFPSPGDGFAERFPCVEVRSDERQGRYMVARRAVSAGQVLGSCEAVALLLTPAAGTAARCAWCCSAAPLKVCTACRAAGFC